MSWHLAREARSTAVLSCSAERMVGTIMASITGARISRLPDGLSLPLAGISGVARRPAYDGTWKGLRGSLSPSLSLSHARLVSSIVLVTNVPRLWRTIRTGECRHAIGFVATQNRF